jgi:hypothetical protein
MTSQSGFCLPCDFAQDERQHGTFLFLLVILSPSGAKE